MKKRLYLILLLAILTVFAQESMALGMGMGMGPPNPPCGVAPFPPCPVPLDGGLIFLAAAGTIYAGRRLGKK
ncbi:MAG TPA: hypothetical protein DIS90_04090 [Cytophagales bacterium]|nr:hypothetical protein [Flavobacteriales bacterium]HCM75536.1 hypothetical protein [Cytophagales bacterium]HRE73182.1 hypothetical protein [Flavobacteriales bacterium]HRJ35868.1 hypothetical protein [Flavobacteriales bacterium]HRJ38489.1 hypothetical protein [Flavobacteriales bacterium]